MQAFIKERAKPNSRSRERSSYDLYILLDQGPVGMKEYFVCWAFNRDTLVKTCYRNGLELIEVHNHEPSTPNRSL